MKKILFLIESMGGGGAEHALLNLVHEMYKNEYYVTVLTLYNGGVYVDEIKKYSNYISVRAPFFRGINYLYKFIPATILHKLFIKDQYDVEIAFLEGISSKIVSGGNKRIKKIAWVRTDVEQYKKNEICYINKNALIKSYKKMDYISFLGVEAKNSFIRRYGVLSNIVVIKNIFKSDNILQMAQEGARVETKYEPVFGSIGRLTHVKGYDRLLNVHIRLVKEGYYHSIILIGDGGDAEKLERKAKANGVHESFIMIGYQNNPYKFFKLFDWFVSSSYLEGFSSVIAESILLDVPVLATKTAGSKELLGLSEFGLVVDNSENGLYNGMKNIIENNSLKVFYKNRLFQRKGYFDYNKAIEENLQFISNLLE